MDRAKPEQLTMTPAYIPGNLTVSEFLDRIEPAIGQDAARRLRLLVENYLDWPMSEDGIDASIPGPSDDDEDD